MGFLSLQVQIEAVWVVSQITQKRGLHLYFYTPTGGFCPQGVLMDHEALAVASMGQTKRRKGASGASQIPSSVSCLLQPYDHQRLLYPLYWSGVRHKSYGCSSWHSCWEEWGQYTWLGGL